MGKSDFRYANLRYCGFLEWRVSANFYQGIFPVVMLR